MKEMNMNERKKMVLAMEYIARQVNDEDVFESWLMCGVADGDINYGSTDVDEVGEYYIEDDNFGDLMTTFLRMMSNAWESGGLYCADQGSYDRDSYKELLEQNS